MSIVWNQKVEVKIHNRNVKKYKDLGFKCDIGDKLIVHPTQLLKVSKGAGVSISCLCDNCDTKFPKDFYSANTKRNQFCCLDCNNRYQANKLKGKTITEKVQTACGYCEKNIFLYPREINKSTGVNFCSTDCMNNSRRGKRVKVYRVMKCVLNCEYCEEQVKLDRHVYKNVMESSFSKISCKDCSSKKIEEIHRIEVADFLAEVDDIKTFYIEVLSGKKEFPVGFFRHATNKVRKPILDTFFKQAIKNKDIESFNTIPRDLNKSAIVKYKLYSLYLEYNSLYDLINICYPSKFMPWDMPSGVKDYWFEKDNRIDAIKWFYNKLLEDNVIEKESDVLHVQNLRKYLKKYKLEGLSSKYYNASTYKWWNEIFPNHFFEWEFDLTSRNYWLEKDNREKALKQLIEEKLKIDIADIPNKISYGFLKDNFQKFIGVCDTHYSSNLFEWINETYPNTFKRKDFYNTITSDGYRMDSMDEVKIHEILVKSDCKIAYFENKQLIKEKFVNEAYNEYYVPDWIINDNIIFEYFGWYNKKQYGKYKTTTKYMDKADRKMKYFHSLKDYRFMPLFPADLKNIDLLISKLNFLNINVDGNTINRVII
ncbi:hypothetical protein [Aquibacillus saliphilus]|uniref:hypothetical protein n=1 Tax=Aquibacillus saliphilus TaxID=1909422 RepID=UPI001CF0559C|nr:hypothetical protein [Aquibacillus saliphilus]